MDKLSDELLVQICHDFTPDELVKAARYSKQFSRIASTLLYPHCNLIPIDSNHQLWTVRRMLDTLIDSPDLRSLVRSIQVPGSKVTWVYSTLTKQTKVSKAKSRVIQQHVSALKVCPDEYRSIFSFELGQTGQDAMVAAILMSLPNLKSLAFGARRPLAELLFPRRRSHPRPRTDDFTDLTYPLTIRLIELSTTHEFANYPLFKNLSSVTLVACEMFEKDQDGWSFGVICTFLKLPSLKQFSAGGFRDFIDEDVWDCQEGASTVTDLSLFNNRASPRSIGKVLRSCKALEKFRCERVCKRCGSKSEGEGAYHYDYDGSYTGFDLDLFRHRNSLRSLTLHTKSDDHPNDSQDAPIQSLAALDVLEYLKVDGDVLWGNRPISQCLPLTAMLPISLTRLVVLGDNHDDDTDCFREYGKVILSEDHRGISEVEVRCTSVQVVKEWEDGPGLPGVSMKEIADRMLGDVSLRLSADEYCSIILYRDKQSEDGEELEDGADLESDVGVEVGPDLEDDVELEDGAESKDGVRSEEDD